MMMHMYTMATSFEHSIGHIIYLYESHVYEQFMLQGYRCWGSKYTYMYHLKGLNERDQILISNGIHIRHI